MKYAITPMKENVSRTGTAQPLYYFDRIMLSRIKATACKLETFFFCLHKADI